jgi:uncharacterized protein (UPF0218 family)
METDVQITFCSKLVIGEETIWTCSVIEADYDDVVVAGVDQTSAVVVRVKELDESSSLKPYHNR